MFAEHTNANDAVRRLHRASWAFDWIDIDPQGFAESSGINVMACFQVAATEAIVCITNGGALGERFGTPATMINTLTTGCIVAHQSQREKQHAAVLHRVLEVETAKRVDDAIERKLALHPLMLYDARKGSGGVVRSYYFYSADGHADWCRRYTTYDHNAYIRVVTPQLVVDVGRLDGILPAPEQVPLIKFTTTGESATLGSHQRQWLRNVLTARIAYLRARSRG
jgi:hypothetical protein